MNDLPPDRFDVTAPAAGGATLAPPPLPPPPPPTTPTKRGSRSFLVAAAVAGALLAGVAVGVPLGFLTRGSSGSSPSATTSPTANAAAAQARALYQQALTAAGASAGFHYVAVSGGGTASQKIVGDAGQDGGTQVITMGSTYGAEQFTLLLVGGTVYFQGNGPALQDQLGVSAANAPGLQGKWVSVASGDGPYSIVAPGITVADQVQETALVPTSTAQISAAAGITRITGTLTPQPGAAGGPAHLDVSAGSHLPIAYVSAVTDSGVTTTSTVTFSGWGTAPSVTAPAASVVAWSTLGASEPPGGYGSGGSTSTQTPQT